MQDALRDDAHLSSRRSQDADRLVITLIQRHSAAMLRLARRHSICADDASDAYQRAIEILLRHAERLDAERAHSWLFTVVRREAIAVAAQRRRELSGEDFDGDRIEARTSASPEDRVLEWEELERSAEALGRLKPREVQAMWQKAAGLSYAEIGERNAWSYTTVNRLLSEGRRTFQRHLRAIESGEACEAWAPVLSALHDGEADDREAVEVRAHLRRCGACRAHLRELHDTGAAVAVLVPVPLVAALHPSAADDAVGWFGRAYEAVAHGLHLRVVDSAIKVQAFAEAASAGKLAAVAASAAALAGGGVAAVERIDAATAEPRVSVRETADRTRAHRTAHSVLSAATRASTAVAAPSGRVATSVSRPRGTTRRRVAAHHARTRPVRRPAPRTASAAAAREFGTAVAAAPAPSHRAAPVARTAVLSTSAPPASRSSTSTPTRSASAAAREFAP